ncbi:hypothetical protein KACHI17_06100 [Sediminibacterium sp. KACHI17]|uniref:histidine kinase n=1 Tax=Sediminibacterium sp. KACHI17 TaxID=1751071 RepID=A0AAT9GGM6_9BACT
MRSCLLILLGILLHLQVHSQQLNPQLIGSANWKLTNASPVKEKITTTPLSFPLQQRMVLNSERKIYKKNIPSERKLIHNGPTIPVIETLTFIGKKLPAPEIVNAPPLQIRDNAIYNLSYTNKEHGFAGTNSFTFAEDDKYNIWISSSNGLIKYDGHQYFLYAYPSPNIATTETSILIDHLKRLWLVSENGIYYIHNDSIFTLQSKTLEFSKINARKVTADKQHRIWIATKEKGVLCINNKTVSIYDKRAGLPDLYIINVFVDKKGDIYIGSGLSGIVIIQPDKMISLFRHPEKLDWNGFLCFAENEDGIWAGLFNGALINIGLKDTIHYSFTGSFREQINDIIPVKTGLWIATLSNGIYYFDKKRTVNINHNNGLAYQSNFRLFHDSFGNIWISTFISGFSRINDNSFYQSDFTNYIDAQVNTVIPEKGKGEWLITFGQGLCYRTKGGIIQYIEPPTEKNKKLIYINDGIVNSDGSLWLGSYAWGPTKVTKNKFTCYKINEIPDNNIITSVKRDFNNTIWFSPIKYGLMYLKNDEFWRYTKRSGLLSENTIRLYTDQEKQVHIVSDAGLQRITRRGLETFYIDNKLFTGIVGEQFIVDSATSILTTSSDGLFIQHHQSIYQLSTNNGLYSNQIKNIRRDRAGRFWIATNRGIESFKMTGLSITEHTIYNESNGRFVSDAQQVFIDDSGYPAWNINGKKLTYDSVFTTPAKKPLFFIKNLILNSDTITGNNDISFLPNQTLIIDYRTIYWGKENHLKLSYQLIHNDKDTIVISVPINGKITLNNLVPGNYQIILKGTEKNKIYYAEPFNIIVNPFWYNTILFRCIIGFSVVAAIILYFRRKAKRQLKINVLLEEKVKEQTATILKEKNALEESLHVIDAQNQEKEVLIEEINHRVKNNLQFIMAMLEMQMNKQYSKETLQALLSTSRRIKAMSLVHEMLYAKPDTKGISITSYIYQLIDNLKEMAEGGNETQVDIKLSIEDLTFDSRKALSMGIIISELMSNSFKHAFKDIQKPQIYIELKKNKLTKNIELVFEDNGNGITTTTNESGLGRRLVDIFSRQLAGSYELTTQNKFRFKLVINQATA